MRSCARRSFDAATIFIALVICCVDLTARFRRRMSKRDGIPYPLRCGSLPSRGERLAKLLQRLIQVRLDRVVDLLLFGEPGQQLRLPCIEELVQLGFVRAEMLDVD